MTQVVLIPSAKRVSIELQAEFGPIPPALIPIGGRPALHYLMERYPDAKFVVALHESCDAVRSYCSRHMGCFDIELIDVNDTATLGETVLVALREMNYVPDSLVVNFADTIVNGVQPNGDAVYYSVQEDVYRWTTFEIDQSGMIGRLAEKYTEKEGGISDLHLFVGAFCIQEPMAFQKVLEAALCGVVAVDPFYIAVSQYFNSRSSTTVLRAAPEWMDIGHLDTYYGSRQRLSSMCREFNTIQIDKTRGSIKKCSRNREKLIEETLWYLKLPRQLQYMIPRVFDYSLDYSDPYIELEYYGYPALNDLYLYGQLDVGAWAIIFQAIERVLDDMSQYCVTPLSQQSVTLAQSSMYVDNTCSRISMYIDRVEFAWASESGIIINGKSVTPLSVVVEELSQILDESGVYSLSSLSVIHGDLCLSNILYDRRNGIIRVVDPRGRFGEYDLYGDPVYDLSKLSHSIEGNYDHLLNGLYELQRDENRVILKIHLTERQLNIQNLYRFRFRRKYSSAIYAKVRLLESLLFLSMVPLHDDRPEAQQAFLTRGLELYSISKEQFIK